MKTLSIKQNQADSAKQNQIDKSVSTSKKQHQIDNLINEECLLKVNTSSTCRITTKNTIKFCNSDFITISGFTEKELLSNSLDLIKHPEMPKTISNFINYHIEKREEIALFVKNKTKDGKYFWTLSSYKPNEGTNLNIAYTISSKAISDKTKFKITKLYDCLYKLESKINEVVALRYLLGFLEEEDMSLTQYTRHLNSL